MNTKYLILSACNTGVSIAPKALLDNDTTNAFSSKDVQKIMQSMYPDVSLYAIHAGLECGELIAHQEKPIEALSIGPTIRFPHSLREECDLDSLERIKKVIEMIMQRINHGIS